MEYLTQAAPPVFGEVKPPSSVFSAFGGLSEGGPTKFLNIILQTMVLGAGIYAVFNFILAGYSFLSAGDDPKKVAGAWAKIWQTVVGLTFAAGAFVLAAIFGKLIFNDYNALLQINVFAPQ